MRGQLIMVNAAERSRKVRTKIDPLHLSTRRSPVTLMTVQSELSVLRKMEGNGDCE